MLCQVMLLALLRTVFHVIAALAREDCRVRTHTAQRGVHCGGRDGIVWCRRHGVQFSPCRYLANRAEASYTPHCRLLRVKQLVAC